MDQTAGDATQVRRTRILETTLDLLIALFGAAGRAVLRVVGRDGLLVRAKNVGPHAIPRWRTAREFDLLSGGPLLRPEYAVLPVRLDGSRIIAFYLQSLARLRPHSLEVDRLLTQVAACLDERAVRARGVVPLTRGPTSRCVAADALPLALGLRPRPSGRPEARSGARVTATTCLLLVAADVPLTLCVAHGIRAPRAPLTWLCLSAAVLAGHVWILMAGEAALQWRPWLLREIAYPAIELVLLAEIVHRRAGAQARTAALGRGVVAALATAMSLAVLVPTGGTSGSAVQAGVILLRVDIALATAYLGLVALLAWHRAAIRPLDVAILVGIVVLRALHALAVWLWIAPGPHLNGDLIQVAEIAVFAWWMAASWTRRKRPRVAMAGA